MDIARSNPVTALAAALSLAAMVSAAHADPSHQWRIEFAGRSDEGGALVLRLNPVNGRSIDVETRIPAGTGDGRVADAVADSLKVSLGERYNVRTSDDDDVIISTRGIGPQFDLTLVRSTLTGVNVGLEKE